MKIDGYHVEQRGLSSHQKLEKQVVNIQVQGPERRDQVFISEEGLELQKLDNAQEDYLSEADKRKIELMEALLSWLTGKEVKFNRFFTKGNEKKKTNQEVKNQGHAQPSFGLRIQTSQEVYEKESVDFSSSGKIKTSDGRSIDFDLNMHMSRETYVKNKTTLEMGNFQDPLILNFDGKGVDFSNETFEIDIDLDGVLDELNFLSEGNGFLALDKNNNGFIDNGTELFGPETNHGFSELAAYDEDKNGWIDENDEIFNKLEIWTLNEAGDKTLLALKEKGVGAIYLGAVNTNYTLKHGDKDLARLSSSSIYLKENGQVNTIHQVDYKL